MDGSGRNLSVACALTLVLSAASASAQSVANLAPVATLTAAPRDADVYAGGSGLVAIGDDTTVCYALDARTPRRTARIDGGRGAVAVAGDAVLRAAGRSIERVDCATGAVLWRTELGAHATVLAAARDGGLVTLTGGAVFEVLTLDLATGRIVRRAAAEGSASTAAGNGLLYALGPRQPLHATDATTGRVRWQQARATASADDTWLDFDAGRLAVAGPAGLAFVDAARGTLVASNPLAVHAAATPVAVGSGTLYVVGAVPGAPGAALYAVDEATGQTRWHSEPVVAMGPVAAPSPRLGHDAVYACMPDGTLAAFDRITGHTLWSWGVGGCREFAVVSAPTGDVVVAQDASRGVVALYARGPRPAPRERLVVQGTLRITGQSAARTRLRVGPVVTRTDASGRFRVALEARGAVSIEPDRRNGAVLGAPVTLALEGRARSYRVEADFTEGPTP